MAKDGWQASVAEGNKAGTTGQAKAVEAMKVRLNTDEYRGSIEYRAHVAKKGLAELEKRWSNSWNNRRIISDGSRSVKTDR